MSVYDLKPRFQSLLRPLVRRLASLGVTANQVTVAAAVLSLVVGGVVTLRPTEPWALLLVPATLLARMALNAVDGMLAREHGQQSHLGAFLNELGDVLSDAFLYLPLAFVPGFSTMLVFATVLSAWATELAGVVAEATGGSRRYDGPMGKSDRALVFGLLFLALGLGWSPGFWGDAVLLAITVLAVVTVLRRVRAALAEDGASQR